MSIRAYRASLRSIVRGFWSGAIDRGQFDDEMRNAINRRLAEAFEEGARECGIRPDEFTQEEWVALGKAVQSELSYVSGLGDAIAENSRENEGKLGPLFTRVEMWVNRYNDVKNRAKTLICGDLKYRWELGPTEHCVDCARMSGRVYRGSVWRKYGILPQSHDLACGGFRCQCSLVPTDEPVTKGRPPKLSTKKMMMLEVA